MSSLPIEGFVEYQGATVRHLRPVLEESGFPHAFDGLTDDADARAVINRLWEPGAALDRKDMDPKEERLNKWKILVKASGFFADPVQQKVILQPVREAAYGSQKGPERLAALHLLENIDEAARILLKTDPDEIAQRARERLASLMGA